MKNKKSAYSVIFSAFIMFMFILDAKTTLSGAKDGINLCLYTVIPALFPFLIVSMLLNDSLIGSRFRLLQPLNRFCGIPYGCESILLLGLIGGYPVGAQAISQAYCSGKISRTNAERLLGFCNNAGPAFIFGMTAGLFSTKFAPWIIWGIQIASALIVGWILPQKNYELCQITKSKQISVTQALERSLRVIADICGWVVIFRVFITLARRWLLWLFPADFSALLTGLLELSNGCLALYELGPQGFRFILVTIFLSAGGLCIAMQTISVTRQLGLGMYFPGKLAQVLLSLTISYFLQYLLFSPEDRFTVSTTTLGIVLLFLSLHIIWLRNRKKVVAIRQKV